LTTSNPAAAKLPCHNEKGVVQVPTGAGIVTPM